MIPASVEMKEYGGGGVIHATGSQVRLNERPDWTRSQSGLSNQQEVTSETIKDSNLGPLATEASAL